MNFLLTSMFALLVLLLVDFVAQSISSHLFCLLFVLHYPSAIFFFLHSCGCIRSCAECKSKRIADNRSEKVKDTASRNNNTVRLCRDKARCSSIKFRVKQLASPDDEEAEAETEEEEEEDTITGGCFRTGIR